MDYKTEEDECNKMLDHLNQYVPHLEKLIVQLKDPKRKNRELQLNKLEGLHSMITDRKKKIKLDTLKKCEDVILKILHKVHPNIYKQRIEMEPSSSIKFLCRNPPEKDLIANVPKSSEEDANFKRFQAARAKLIELSTPASPSPPREIPVKHTPIMIPTEKVPLVIPNADNFHLKNWEQSFELKNRATQHQNYAAYESEKPNVYSQVRDSLATPVNKKIFDRLGTKVDMSKPPLSAEDLERLTSPEREVCFDDAQELTMGELQDLRQVLQKKLQLNDEKLDSCDLRNKLNLKESSNNKFRDKEKNPLPVSKPVPLPVPPPKLPPVSPLAKPRSPRVEKIFKNPDSKFGNLLSSIDEKILGDTTVKKKEKKDPTKETTKCDSKSSEKDAAKKDKKDKKLHSDGKKNHHKKDHKKDKKGEKHKHKEHSKSKHHENKGETSKTEVKPHTETKTNDITDSNNDPSIKETKDKEVPTYKRLADKYNPKPRKTSIDCHDKKPIEDSPKLSEKQPIPFLENSFPSPNEPYQNEIITNKPIDPRLKSFRPPMENRHSWFESPSPIIDMPEKSGMNQVKQQQHIIKTPLLKTPPIGNLFPLNTQNNLQLNFAANIPLMRQKEIIPNQYNMSNQNVPNPHTGNTYLNTFIVQSNVNSNMSHTQFNHSHNNTVQNNFNNQAASNKAFHPYDPIDNSNEYDMTKMQPTDFYSPHFNKGKRSLHSHYGGQYQQPTRERPLYGNRAAKPETWTFENKNQWNERSQHQRERDETRPVNRDPRCRQREMKDKTFYGTSSAAHSRQKLIDDNNTYCHNKYDSLYSTLERDKEKESFVSPLDSLYSAGEDKHKTGKGYGFQKFKIPKKKNEPSDKHLQIEESHPELKDGKEKNEVNTESVQSLDEDPTNRRPNTPEPTERPASVELLKQEEKAIAPTPEVRPVEDVKASPSEQSIITNFFTSLIAKTEKKEILSALLSSLKDTITDQEKKHFKRIQKIIDSDSEDEKDDKKESPAKSEDSKKSEDLKEEPKTSTKEEDSTSETTKEDEVDEIPQEVQKVKVHKVIVKKAKLKMKKIIKKNKAPKKIKRVAALKAEQKLQKDNETVIVTETVGERIKNRRRNIKSIDCQKARRCRTELDMLHEDIKEMFIRDGVLTATGKRMCRILKPASSESEVKSLKSKSLSSLDEDTTLDSPKRRARISNPKVMLEKTDFSKLTNNKVHKKVETDSDDEALDIRLKKITKSKIKDTDSDISDSPAHRMISKRNIKNKPKYTEDTDEESPLSPVESEISKPSISNPSLDDSETSSVLSQPVSLPQDKKRMKKKKRGQNWASGVITKKNVKKKASSISITPTPSLDRHTPISDFGETTEDSVSINDVTMENELEFIEPDINYYFEQQDRIDCKICQFKGKMIVHHYKSVHPKYEVLISRLSPQSAKLAKEETIEKDFENIEISNTEDGKARRKKYNYQCRFCNNFIRNENTEYFYDHICSHTGEYRFPCYLCPFKTANCKSLKAHLHTSHNTKAEPGMIVPLHMPPPDFHLVFAYMCGECNFIQLFRSTVETHAKIYHLGDNQKIYKVNMSLVNPEYVPESGSVSDTASAPCDINEENSELSINNKDSEKKLPDEGIETSKDAAINTSSTNKSKVEIETPPIPLPPPPATVFKYNINESQENKQLEEQKHEKMLEINSTIIPKKKFSFNLLDKIKSRLDDKVSELIKNDEVPNISAPQDPSSMCVDSCNENNLKSVKKCMEAEVKNNKIEYKIVPDILDKPIINKNSIPITNIIERLQGKLNVDATQPPPLIPLNEFKIEPKTEDTAVHVGPVAASKKNSCNLFICYMQSCMYSSTNKADFEVHCKTLHDCEGSWDGYCNVCDQQIDSTRVIDAYYHLLTMHTNEVENSFSTNEEDIESQIKVTYLRTRRLSGDKLSETHTSEKVVNSENEYPFENPIVPSAPDVVTEEEHNFPFQICRVESLADDVTSEPEDISFVKPKGEPMLSTLTFVNNSELIGGGSKQLNTPITIPLKCPSGTEYNIVLPMLTTIPKQLIAVTSPPKLLAKALSSPKPIMQQLKKSSNTPRLIASKPQTKKVMLKDTPLHPEELVKARKSAPAVSCLLTENKIIHLYKCPEKACTYSTDTKKMFELHLTQHTEFKPGMQVPCLYCNFKTDYEFYAIHCDIRHGRCQYCCAYCFYRGFTQSYVEMHQEREHTLKPRRVLMIGINQDALMSQAQMHLPELQKIIPLYTCAQKNCKSKYILPDDFREHLASVHQGAVLLCNFCQMNTNTPVSVVKHMQIHNIYYFHCRYCLFGGNSADDIYKHLAHQHFALSPVIVVRQFNKGVAKVKKADCYNEDPKQLENLKTITTEHYRYLSPVAMYDMTAVDVPNKQPSQTVTVATNAKCTISTPLTYAAAKPKEGKRLSSTNNNSSLKVNEPKNSNTKPNQYENDSDVDVVQVSDDESDKIRAPSPIVLNKFMGSSKERLKIKSLLPVSSNEKTKNVKPKEAADLILIQPESEINGDDTLLNVVTKPSEEIDPLQLESEPSVPTETNISEDSFSEAKLDFSFTDHGVVEEFSDITLEELSFSKYNTTRKLGLVGTELFRCGFCKAGFETSNQFKNHVSKCMELNQDSISKPFKCAHCVKHFKSLNSLTDHIRVHGTLRFSCSLCDFKHQHQLYVRSHLKTRHKITSVVVTPVDPTKRCLDEDEFVLRPKIYRIKSIETNSSKDSVAADEMLSNKTTKLSYGPDEIEVIPIRPIFNNVVKCSTCEYSTKVRANLIRHLQFHTTRKEMPVPAAAPVNPVPCLEKNEKMFDKMTNLALSSFKDTTTRMSTKVEKKETIGISKTEEALLPSFIPTNKRYVCGANLCDYLCLEEGMLRYHLLALHSNESSYKCLHCDETLSTEKINIDFIIKHLRLHDLHLYKCGHCKFLHRLKSKVYRHISDKHPDQSHHLIVVRELEEEPEKVQEPEEIKETRPWRCGMCKYRCANKEEMVSHASKKHDVETQFKCALCQFRNNDRPAFMVHFNTDHAGHNIDVIDAYYEVQDTPPIKNPSEGGFFDTTPLWQRDKNKFKHIRGIPIDETNRLKKSPAKAASNASENLDKAIEAVASGNAEITLKEILKNSSKKPKTLKEKKMVYKSIKDDVIEIEDDGDVAEKKDVAIKTPERRMSVPAIVRDEKSKEEHVPELILEVKKQSSLTESDNEISLEAIEEMDLEKLRNTDLSGTYGPFGRPSNKQFLCPLCSLFKTKKVDDITSHLYKELHYDRFVCTNCALTGISYNFLHKHSLKKHLTESIHPISPNPRIEAWVQKVLAIQRRLMNNNSIGTKPTLPTEKSDNLSTKNDANAVVMEKSPINESSDTKTNSSLDVADLPDSSTGTENESGVRASPGMHNCPHCTYSCKGLSDLRKHEKRHWAQKPLKCAYCDVEGVTKYEIMQHSKRAHPTLEPVAIPVPMPSTPTIKPIIRKRKYPKNIPDNNASPPKSQATEASSNTSSPIAELIMKDVLAVNETKVEDALIYVCHYCPKRANTELEIMAHWESTHKLKHSIFKYKKVLRSQLSKKGTINYKCFYCEYIGYLDCIKKHFRMEHATLNFSVLRYKCGHCNLYFKNIDQVKGHCQQKHKGDVSYLDIQDPTEKVSQERQNQFVCELCDIDFELRKELVDHHSALHSHLELNLPPELSAQPQEEEKEMKLYKCPECQHTSNSYGAMRDHLRGHAKPFGCSYCPARYTYPSFVKIHQTKEHPDMEHKYEVVPGASDFNEFLRKSLLKLNKDGVYERISATKSQKRLLSDQGNQSKKFRIVDVSSTKQKLTARKSTTQAIKISEGYSYYGNKPDLIGLDNVKTTVAFMGSMVTMNIAQLGGFLDISPTVPIVDCCVTHESDL